MPVAPFKHGSIHYREEGTGRVVILLHGFLESSLMWQDLLPELSKSKRVIAIDLPGHGESECFGYVHSMELMAEAVKAVMDHLSVRKAVLVGHSMGGYVALAFAEQHPDWVKGMCLYFSTTHADSDERKRGRNLSINLVKRDHKSFIRKSVPLLFRPKNRATYREQINRLKKQALKTPKQGIIAALEGMKNRIDREMIIQFSPYPVHFVIGRYDPVLPYQKLIDQAENSEQASYTLFPDCGHMGFIEEQEASIKVLRSFANKCYG